MSVGPWNSEEENFNESNGEDNKHPTIVQVLAKEAVKQLSAKQKAIWEARYMDGLTQEEISLKLNISQQAISKHLKAAEKRINKWSEKHKKLFNTLLDSLGPKDIEDRPNGIREAQDASHKTPIKQSEHE